MSEAMTITSRPTPQLQFVRQYNGDRVQLILQQLWVPTDPMSDLYPEWKDVPISEDVIAYPIGNK